jgi:hypothetical protein
MQSLRGGWWGGRASARNFVVVDVDVVVVMVVAVMVLAPSKLGRCCFLVGWSVPS